MIVLNALIVNLKEKGPIEHRNSRIKILSGELKAMHHLLTAAEMPDVAGQDLRKVVNMIASYPHLSIRHRRQSCSVIRKAAGCQKNLSATTLCLLISVTESENTQMEGTPITTMNEIMVVT